MRERENGKNQRNIGSFAYGENTLPGVRGERIPNNLSETNRSKKIRCEENLARCGLPDQECRKERARGNHFADEYEKENTEAPEMERYR